MELPYNRSVMPLLDTRHLQVKISVSGMGHLSLLVIAVVHDLPSELEIKTLKIPHT